MTDRGIGSSNIENLLAGPKALGPPDGSTYAEMEVRPPLIEFAVGAGEGS
jgi:hypothetical protein